MDKEHPAEHLAPLIHTIAIVGPAEDVLGIVVFFQVQDDRSSLKNAVIGTVGILESGNASVRIDLEEPFLLLFVFPQRNAVVVDLEVGVDCFELLGEVGHLLSVGRSRRVEDEWLHDCAKVASDWCCWES